MINSSGILKISGLVFVGFALAACGGGGGEDPGSGNGGGDTGNTSPTISGVPNTSITVNASYSFTPVAADPDGDTLDFNILNKPAWAEFNSSTGALSGSPASSDIGSSDMITISVSDGQASASLAPFSITVSPASTTNNPPSISGVPLGVVAANTAYSFTPAAVDPDGDTLTFSVENKPNWASFDQNTGRLFGTPSTNDVGTSTDISIRVTDGTDTASLAAFAITVNAIASGSVSLAWTPPTENTDNSPLTNLAGYKIYYGTTAGSYPNVITLSNPGLATYVVENLSPATYHFVITAFDADGNESGYSNPASKTIP